jgi:hypothetical protein
MCRSKTRALLALAAVLALGGCADVPAQPMETARAAMDRAVALGAEEFAGAGYEQLVRIRAAMEAELDTQEGRLAPFRSFRRTADLADSLRIMAEAVSTVAGERHAALRMEISSLLDDGAQSVQDLNTQLTELRTDRLPPGELARLQARVAAADTAFAEARMLLDAGRDVEARDRAAFAAHELYEVQARLVRAREARGG